MRLHRRYHRWGSSLGQVVYSGRVCQKCGDVERLDSGPRGGLIRFYKYADGGKGPRRDCDRGQRVLTAAAR
jgi:hypothetical protein